MRPLPPAKLAHRSAGAVAVLTTDVGRGMAFVIDPSGYLLTNRHVIEDADHIEHVVFPAIEPELKFTSVRIVYIDPLRDLALLKVESDRPLISMPLATDRAGPTGDYVASKDEVMMLSRELAPGEIAHSDDQPVGAREVGLVAHLGEVRGLEVYNPVVGPGPFLGMSMDVHEGHSGGPVVDRYGRAVGIVTWTWRHRSGGFAIPIGEANRMLEERPRLEGTPEHEARIRSRADAFLLALGTGEIDGMRRLTSPSHAREFRGQVLPALLEQTMVQTTAVEEFLEAIDDLVKTAKTTDSDPFPRFERMAVETGAPAFRERVGLPGMHASSVVAFFFEFGQAYLAARYFADRSQEDALRVALERVHSLEAARNLVLASRADDFEGAQLDIEKVELIPGQYAPRAVVTLRREGAPREARIAWHMRLEWGDWYVGEVQAMGRR
jgi:hypothetical protein